MGGGGRISNSGYGLEVRKKQIFDSFRTNIIPNYGDGGNKKSHVLEIGKRSVLYSRHGKKSLPYIIIPP